MRHTWELLKPLEPNVDTINVERHLPTQFQLGPPKTETGMLFRPSYGNIVSAANPVSPLSPDTEIQFRPIFPPESSSPDPSRYTPQSSLVPPGSPGFRQRLDTPQTDFSRSDNPSSLDGAVEAPLPLFSTSSASDPQPPHRQESVVSFEAPPLTRKKTTPSIAPEKSKSRWRSKLTGSRKESFAASIETSSLSSTSLESQRLDEISLKSLTSAQKIVRGRGAKNISVSLSQNSTYALFWTQPTIHLWDIGTSPPSMRREISTDGNCVLAAVTKMYLAYIIGTRDQRLTVSVLIAAKSLVSNNL